MITLYSINNKVQILNSLNTSFDDSNTLDNVYNEVKNDVIQYNKENEIKVALTYNEHYRKYELKF